MKVRIPYFWVDAGCLQRLIRPESRDKKDLPEHTDSRWEVFRGCKLRTESVWCQGILATIYVQVVEECNFSLHRSTGTFFRIRVSDTISEAELVVPDTETRLSSVMANSIVELTIERAFFADASNVGKYNARYVVRSIGSITNPFHELPRKPAVHEDGLEMKCYVIACLENGVDVDVLPLLTRSLVAVTDQVFGCSD